MSTVLVLGRTGQLASALARKTQSSDLSFAGRDEIDLADPEATYAAICARAPHGLINAAAYTAVDKAEAEPDLAHAINVVGVAAAAKACAALNIPMVHVSTDYVYDGTKTEPYQEQDPIAPLGVYGRTKALGEAAIGEANVRAAILRTAWVYGPTGTNFVRTMLRLAQTREEVGVVADQIGSPTHVDDLAQACLAMLRRLQEASSDAEGVFHYAGAGEASWADVAETTFEAARSCGLPAAAVKRITTAEYPTPARRPQSSRLNCAKIEGLGIALRPWRGRVADCVAAIARDAAEGR